MYQLFISIAFSAEFDGVSNTVRTVAESRGLSTYRGDDGRTAVPIAEDVRSRIAECRIVVADVSGMNPNVYHEVGLAQAFGKTLILLTRDMPEKTAVMLRGMRVIVYDPTNLASLKKELERALVETVSPNELLRAMLVPDSLGRPTRESRFVVAISPLSYRRAMARTGGYERLRRTASDYVGLRGIMQAFGLLYDFDALPDIVDPEDCKNEVLSETMTLYCVASPKANRWTQALLEKYKEDWRPRLEFRADEKSPNLRNIRVSIFSDNVLLHPYGWDFESPGDRHERDFGVIVRGPNPYDRDQMVAVLAGRSSLGTEAACHAFLSPKLLQQLRDRLQGHHVDLENHEQPFWALVSMHKTVGDGLEEARLDTLTLERVEPFLKRRR